MQYPKIKKGTFMKELVVISGKGGTGKTSVVAGFASLAEKKVLADCDVDAADLHLILKPKNRKKSPFSGGKIARIKTGHCIACGKCEEVCRFDAVFFDGPGNGLYPKTFRVDPISCEGCGVCAWFCNENAIEFKEAINGELFISDTRCGPMVHACLGVAQENSGKLVTLVKKEAKDLAEKENLNLIIIDGSPGIGCPVIASITGANLILIVTEPTLSGRHDLERVLALTSHFGIRSMVCINKYDLNTTMASEMENFCAEHDVAVAGRLSYDNVVTEAQIAGKSIVEYTSGGVADELRSLWRRVSEEL
jgi:MinD superfamily P-loop ATPase